MKFLRLLTDKQEIGVIWARPLKAGELEGESKMVVMSPVREIAAKQPRLAMITLGETGKVLGRQYLSGILGQHFHKATLMVLGDVGDARDYIKAVPLRYWGMIVKALRRLGSESFGEAADLRSFIAEATAVKGPRKLDFCALLEPPSDGSKGMDVRLVLSITCGKERPKGQVYTIRV